MKPLDLAAVRAFALVAESNSFTRAAEAMGLPQSAISLKVQRLERALGQRLFERTPRRVRLSAQGELFLPAALRLIEAHEAALAAFATQRRRFSVGFSHHVVGADLPSLLKRVATRAPWAALAVEIGTSTELIAAHDAGRLDAVIALRSEHPRRSGERVLREPVVWCAAPEFDWPHGAPLPLAAQSESCGVRAAAVAALDGAGIPWVEAFLGGGAATLAAAVAAGLAVAALSRRVLPLGVVECGERFALPPLPAFDLVAHASLADPKARAVLAAIVAALRAGVS